MNAPVNIGDGVYVPRAWSCQQERVPCPVCYGNLFAVLELGNGERVQVECEACGIGHMEPRGWVSAPRAGSEVSSMRVVGLELRGERWFVLTGDHQKFEFGVEAFDDAGAADAKRAELFAKMEIEAFERAGAMAQHARKKVTWHVNYHRDQLRRANFDVEYHGRKLSDALARRRTAKTETT